MRSFTGPSVREGRAVDTTPTRREAAPEGADYVDVRVLVASTQVRHPVPAGAEVVNFSSNGDFYCLFGVVTSTITVPVSDVTDGSAPTLNPATRIIPEAATHIILTAPVGTIVTMEFWSF